MCFLYSGLLVAIEANGSAATKESGCGRASGPGILHRISVAALSLSPSSPRPAPPVPDSDACELPVNFPAFYWQGPQFSLPPNRSLWIFLAGPSPVHARASEAASFRGPRRNEEREVRGRRASGPDSVSLRMAGCCRPVAARMAWRFASLLLVVCAVALPARRPGQSWAGDRSPLSRRHRQPNSFRFWPDELLSFRGLETNKLWRSDGGRRRGMSRIEADREIFSSGEQSRKRLVSRTYFLIHISWQWQSCVKMDQIIAAAF